MIHCSFSHVSVVILGIGITVDVCKGSSIVGDVVHKFRINNTLCFQCFKCLLIICAKALNSCFCFRTENAFCDIWRRYPVEIDNKDIIGS